MTDFGNIRVGIIYATDAELYEVVWKEELEFDDILLNEGHTAIVPRYPEAGERHLCNGEYDDVTMMAVQNTEKAGGDDFTVRWTDNDANANIQNVPPGQILVIPDVDGGVQIAAGIDAAALDAATLKVAMFSR